MIFKIYRVIRFILFIIFSLISIYASKFYEGSILIFGFYCFFLILTVFYLTSDKASYFEIFFSCYIFLGFWFKYIFSLILYNGKVFDSGQMRSVNIDQVLTLVIFVSLVCLISSFINKNFMSINEKRHALRYSNEAGYLNMDTIKDYNFRKNYLIKKLKYNTKNYNKYLSNYLFHYSNLRPSEQIIRYINK
jgi:hypothetical protein